MTREKAKGKRRAPGEGMAMPKSGVRLRAPFRLVIAFAFVSGLSVLVVQFSGLLGSFPITHVHIVGEFKSVDRQAVRQSVAELASTNYFSVDLYAIRDRVMMLPWVEEVRVARVWPASIGVVISEKKPVARWGDGRLVSNKGEIFEAKGGAVSEDLPHLSGPDDASYLVMSEYRAMGGVLRNVKFKIRALHLDSRYTWHLQLDNGIAVTVDKTNSLRKIQRFVSAYHRWLVLDGRKIDKVDLRYASGMAIKWQEA